MRLDSGLEQAPGGAMTRTFSCFLAAGLLALSACAAPTMEAPAPSRQPATPVANPSVGGAAMNSAQSIGANLARSSDHRTLVAALNAAGLLGQVQGSGRFTLFAPGDAAFARLPRGTMESLMAPASRALLAQLLNYHIVPGSKTRNQILADIAAGGGAATYQTASGGRITVAMEGGSIVVRDIHGNRVPVTIPDAIGSNGVMHVMDGVLLPAT
jgi:uncharacterized surface protein with fasciclin (FAS1) repeats